MERNNNVPVKQTEEFQKSRYKGRMMYYNGCGERKCSMEMRSKSYSFEKYCSGCYPLFTSN